MTTPFTNRYSFFKTYGKSVIAFLFVLWTAFSPLYFGDGKLEREEWIIFAVAVGNNLLVYIIPNTNKFRGVKTTINAILVALAALQTVILDGWQPDDLTVVIGALLTALGVAYVGAVSNPNTEPVVVPKGLTTG